LTCVPIKPQCGCLEIEKAEGESFICERCPQWHIPNKAGTACVPQKCKEKEIIGAADMCHPCIECQVGSLPDPKGDQKCMKVICPTNKTPFEDCKIHSPCACGEKYTQGFTDS